jgi:hypothetical protein
LKSSSSSKKEPGKQEKIETRINRKKKSGGAKIAIKADLALYYLFFLLPCG